MRRILALAAILATVVAASLSSLAATPAEAEPSSGVPGVARADAAELDLGVWFGCAIVHDGSVRCWGNNTDGQLGQGHASNVGDSVGETTVAVPLPGPARSVSAGNGHACAVLESGQVRCWGWNGAGQLGQGNTATIGNDPGEAPVAVDLGAGRSAVAVTAGTAHTCALLDNGQVRCWGTNAYGQLGQGNTANIGDNAGETTVLVDLPRPAVALSAARLSTCAVLDTGRLRCWGVAAYGQLLQGDGVDHVGDEPGETTVAVDPAGRTVLALTGGVNGYCAIVDDGSLHCWGHGVLGPGGLSDIGDDPGETSAPVIALPPGRTARAVSSAFDNTCVVLDDGQVSCWGDNLEGQLGQGNNQTIGDNPGEGPVAVDLGAPARSIAVGERGVCAVTATGLRCWGRGDEGQLALGSTSDYGALAGQVPRLLPPIALGGQQVGRDRDGDGARDAVDPCPTVVGVDPALCASHPVRPGAVLRGRKVVIDVVLARKNPTATSCPSRARVAVTARTGQGRTRAVKQLRTELVPAGCRVHGKVVLPAKPRKKAAVRVAVSGKRLVRQRLVAVRR